MYYYIKDKQLVNNGKVIYVRGILDRHAHSNCKRTNYTLPISSLPYMCFTVLVLLREGEFSYNCAYMNFHYSNSSSHLEIYISLRF